MRPASGDFLRHLATVYAGLRADVASTTLEQSCLFGLSVHIENLKSTDTPVRFGIESDLLFVPLHSPLIPGFHLAESPT